MKFSSFVCSILVGVALFLLAFASTKGSACRTLNFDSKKNGKRLLNHLIERKQASSDDWCMLFCLSENNCMSINFNQTEDRNGAYLCELNDSDEEQNPEDLRNEKDSSYYGAKSPCSNNPCKGNAVCETGSGCEGHRCLCPAGYSGEACDQDIIECDKHTDLCHVNADCINTLGSYDCVCLTGYTGNGFFCEDVDECVDGKHNCRGDTLCNNTAGSFSCVCKSGFISDKSAERCQDEDECLLGSHNCLPQARCHNTHRSYDCTCNEGFQQDGITICNVKLITEEVKQREAMLLSVDNPFSGDYIIEITNYKSMKTIEFRQAAHKGKIKIGRSHLNPYTLYDVRVRHVKNASQLGEWSLKALFKTLGIHPSFIKVPENITYWVAGENATIQCNASGVPKPTVEWTRLQLPFPQGRSQQQDGRLSISAVQLNDSGNYTCKASNELGFINTTTNLVAVQVKVTIENSESSKAVLSIDSGPWPTYIIELNNRQNMNVTEFRQDVQRGNVTKIDLTNLDPDTLYSVRVRPVKDSNQLGKWSNETLFKTRGIHPSFTKVPENVTYWVTGEKATIECNASGVPKPTVEWTRLQLPFPQGRSQQQDGRLSISAVQLNDSGNYTCKASNELGFINTTTNLVAVQVKVTIEDIKSSKAVLSIDSGPWPAYIIELANCQNMNVTEFRQDAQRGNVTKIDLTNLDPDTLYSVRVRPVKDSNQLGKWSNETLFKTRGIKVTIEDMESSKAVLSIDSGPWPTYIIELTNRQNMNVTEFRQDAQRGNVTKIDLTNLDPDTSYSVRVRPVEDSNHLGKWSNETLFRTRGIYPSFIKVPENITYWVTGENATIECNASGVPKPTVEWTRLQLPFPQGRRQQQNGRLSISAIQLNDSGNYTCTASNELGFINTTTNLVAVQVKVTIEDVESSKAVLSIDSGPWPAYIIELNNRQNMNVTEFRQDAQRGNVTKIDLTNLDPDTLYSVRVRPVKDSNQLGKWSKETLFKTRGIHPSFIKVPENVTYWVTGENATIECNASGVPKPTVEWTRLQLPFPHGRSQQQNGRLSISAVQLNDSGNYTCTVSNELGFINTTTNLVAAQVKVTIEDIKSSKAVLSIDSGPWPAYIIELNNRQNMNVTEFRQDAQRGIVTKIDLTNLDPDTLYSVRVRPVKDSNQLGKWSKETLFKTRGIYPSFTKVPENITYWVAGENAMIECNASGVPKPTVEWTRLQLSFPQGRSQQKDGRLSISAVQLKDSGYYTCKASNELGFINTTTNLVAVQGCPSSVSGYCGEFISPHYPDNYLHYLNYSWRITVPSGYLVQVEFDTFVTETKFDYLVIYDGPLSSSSQLAWLTGSLSTPRTYLSSGLSMSFNFFTDFSITRKGFKASYTAVLSSRCPSSVSGYYGEFISPHYPDNYLHYLNCSWCITVPSGYLVQVEFDTFETENNYDYLVIYDGPSSSSSQLAWLTGSLSTPRTNLSSGLSVSFNFVTDGSVTKKGFKASYTAVLSSG